MTYDKHWKATRLLDKITFSSKYHSSKKDQISSLALASPKLCGTTTKTEPANEQSSDVPNYSTRVEILTPMVCSWCEREMKNPILTLYPGLCWAPTHLYVHITSCLGFNLSRGCPQFHLTFTPSV